MAGKRNNNSRGGGSGGDGNGAAEVVVLKKGPWTPAEDAVLVEYVTNNGEGNWNAVMRNTELKRCGKSCRLRWANHLRPNLKKGIFTVIEERAITELHAKYGNKWARMATQLPGRTDNEIKNYWNTRTKRRRRVGLPMYPYDIQLEAAEFHLQQLNERQEHHQLRQQRLHHPLQQQQRSHLPSFSPISPPPPPPPPTYNNPPPHSGPTYNNPPHSGPPFSLFDSLRLSRTPPPQTPIRVYPTNSSFLTISNHHPNTLQFNNFFPNTTTTNNNDGFALPLSPVSTLSATNSSMSPMPPSPFFSLNNNNTQNLINNQWFPPTQPPPPPPPSLHFNPSPNFMGLDQFEQTSGGFTQLLGMEQPLSQSTTTTTPTSFNYHATNDDDSDNVVVEPLLLIPHENPGLLDDMLMESEAHLSKEISKRNNEVVAKGFVNKGKEVMMDEFIMVDSTIHHQFNDSSSSHSSPGMKSTPTLPTEEEMGDFEDEVLNYLLDGFSDSSNGQSSCMEGDNIACWVSP